MKAHSLSGCDRNGSGNAFGMRVRNFGGKHSLLCCFTQIIGEVCADRSHAHGRAIPE